MPHKGFRHSEEARAKMRLAHAGQSPTRLGVPQSEEAKALLREARSRQVHPKLAARGITMEMIKTATAKGLKWCSGALCKDFVQISQFAGNQTNGKCKKCVALNMQKRRNGLTIKEKAKDAEYFSKWRINNEDHVRRSWLLKRYGVTPEWYVETLEKQGGHCAFCSATADGRSKSITAVRVVTFQYLLVDHDHETGKARGLLCAKCNTALHRVEYVDDWALKAIEYLRRHGSDRKSKAEWIAIQSSPAPAQQGVD
jgi:hypothetical protein